MPIKSGMLKWICAAAILGFATNAHAVVVSLHSSNVGIASINVTVSGTTITIEEDWSSDGIGVLEFSQLEPLTDYTIEKVITNNSAADWTRFANELLDPLGQDEDSDDPLPYPAFVPAGFSTSNDVDGLSFAQGSGLPRTSSVWSSVLADELSDARDFLDFFDGTLTVGSTDDFMTFGLRENFGTQQPFLLVQRPNAFSRQVPEPAAALIFGLGLAGLGFARRKRAA